MHARARAVGSLRVAGGKLVELAVHFSQGRSVLLAANEGYSDAYAINDSNVAVGEIFEGEAAIFTPNGKAFAIPGQCLGEDANSCFENLALAINKSGVVLGNYLTEYFDHAHANYVGFLGGMDGFSRVAPSCFDDDCPIQYRTNDYDYIVSLNDGGDFVGSFSGAPWVSFSPVGDANGLLPANSGWIITSVAAINNRRQIVGLGRHVGYGNATRAFLLEPAK